MFFSSLVSKNKNQKYLLWMLKLLGSPKFEKISSKFEIIKITNTVTLAYLVLAGPMPSHVFVGGRDLLSIII